MEFENDLSIIGTSPEDLLKVNKKKATILPIAGTRRRGKTFEEDLELEKELLADKKEIAETGLSFGCNSLMFITFYFCSFQF